MTHSSVARQSTEARGWRPVPALALAGAVLLTGCGAADPGDGGAWQDGELAEDSQASSKWYCGASCNGTDPADHAVNRGDVRHCSDDAVTVSSTGPFYGRTLQLRYSNTCETVWARVWGGQFQDKIFLQEQLDHGWTDALTWEMDHSSDP